MIKPLTAWIIDDDEIYKFLITKLVESNSLIKKLLTFANGEESMQFLKNNITNSEELPDIIFLDINMPIMNGWQFIDEYIKFQQQHTFDKKISIYIMTSSIDPTDIERAKSNIEISDYLIKPINAEKVFDIIIDNAIRRLRMRSSKIS